MQSKYFFIFLFVAFLALPASGASIPNGIDAWATPGNGSSFASFADDPIPAGFFCAGSKPFTGRIQWKGVPLVSQPANALGGADTIVQRLDDLVFDREGRAVTRLQMRALSMEGLEPIVTRCGAFTAKISLAAVQPMTTMEVVQEGPGSGYWSATLGVNAKLSFTPVRGVTALPLVLEQAIELRVDRALWSDKPADGSVPRTFSGFILVDTDGDQSPDTFLPGPSAFFARKSGESSGAIEPACSLPGAICHYGSTGEYCHCTELLPLSD